MPTTSELACSTATKTLARPSRMVIVCVMSVPHISLTLSVMIVPSCGLVSVRPTRCGASRPFSRIMVRRSSDREAIEAEIDRVRSLGLDELRALWRTTLRSSPPPAFSKDLVARFLCWHIQEQAFGGLDPDTAKLLEGFARGA